MVHFKEGEKATSNPATIVNSPSLPVKTTRQDGGNTKPSGKGEKHR